MTDDRELLARITGHDEAAFEQLCARYGEPLRRHLARITRADDTADDLLQDTLLRIWTYAAQWDGRGAPAGWLFRIATSVALNALRSERRRPRPAPATHGDTLRHDEWMADQRLGPEELAERAEEYDRLRSLVAQLPEEKREVLRMVHGDELSLAEVARVLGVPPGTVRSRLHYATRRLARELNADTSPSD
jgi:RNA polymerase sigma-70 factor, ECF subfamily